jgi:hypothetical protein
MRDYTDAQQQSDWIMPPMFTTGATGGVTGSTVPVGEIYPATGPTVLACSTTVVVVDLTTICGSGAKARVQQGNDDWNPDPICHYLTLEADGDDIYFAFGDSVANVVGISPTQVTAVQAGTTGPTGQALNPFTSSGGTVGGGTVGCLKIPNNTSKDYKLPLGTPPVGTPTDNSAPLGKWSPARYLAFRSNTGATVFLRMHQSSP